MVHVLSAPIPEGVEVEGEIDWPRRFRHMQRHTAQHLLSQALLRAGGYHTVAVSLDSPVCTVDLEEEAEEAGVLGPRPSPTSPSTPTTRWRPFTSPRRSSPATP